MSRWRESKWLTPIPIWVSRPTAEGGIAKFEVNLLWFFTIGLTAAVGATLWVIIGLIVAVQTLLGMVL